MILSRRCDSDAAHYSVGGVIVRLHDICVCVMREDKVNTITGAGHKSRCNYLDQADLM